MQVSAETQARLVGTMSALKLDRLPWWTHWRKLADYILPRRYVWLLSGNERKRAESLNPYILDPTGTRCARVLASGMMNGVTSPGRPWFKIRNHNYASSSRVDEWCEEVARRMMLVMAESNFYNAMAVMYLDLVVFGTSAMLIYEDRESVIRCYNTCLGEYYVAQSDRLQVNTFAREFEYKVHQMVERWGLENCSPQIRDLYKKGGSSLQASFPINHLIEPNIDHDRVPGSFEFRETYWEAGRNTGQVLARRGFHEFPVIAPRWELAGNDSYGSSPGMDALPDIIQLQHETKRKAQSLDYMNRPPMVADVALSHSPMALLPGGISFVSGASQIGAKPAYQIQPPIAELTADLRDVQLRIGETFHNPLFNMISQLDTVRSATEIDARREEKLVLLGPVLERFENEALDPAIHRIFQIMWRSGLIPEPPEEIAGQDMDIQYVSILSSAQRAIGVAPVERFLQVVGNMAAIAPQVLNVPKWENILYHYGRDVGVAARDINTPEEAMQRTEEQNQTLQSREEANSGLALAKGAQTLSQTDVGGGANALQQLLGG